MLRLWGFIFAGGYFGSNGQPDNDFEAARPKIFGTYGTVVHTNRFRSDGEPETIPSRCFRVPVDSIEGLKYRLARIVWHPRAIVPNRENCQRFWKAPIDLQNDLDIGSRPREADCVANNVFTSTSERVTISIPQNNRACSLETHGFAEGLCFEVAVSCRFLDELSEIHVFSFRGRKPGFQAREGQKLSHK